VIALALPAVIFGLLLWLPSVRLGKAGYSSFATLVALLWIAAISTIAWLTNAIAASLLALVLYLAADRAVAVLDVRSARNVIGLGTALAAAELVHPLGTPIAAIAAIAVSVLYGRFAPRGQGWGLLVPLLFMPVGCAVLIAYLDPLSGMRAMMVGLQQTAANSDTSPLGFDYLDPRARGVLTGAVAALVGLPIWISAAGSRHGAAVGCVGGALIAAILFCAMWGRNYPLASFLPAIAALSALSFAEGRKGAQNAHLPIGPGIFSTALSWLLALVA
jgi:hypothetical protein